MLKRKQLEHLSQQIRGANKGGMKSALARGLPFYGRLPEVYPTHFNCFRDMQNRCRAYKLETDFTRDVQGLIDFMIHIGDVPEGMVDPTVGRDDHDVGYVLGNFKWQAFADNARESANRNLSDSSVLKRAEKQTALMKSNHAKLLKKKVDVVSIDYPERGWKRRLREELDITNRVLDRLLENNPRYTERL